MAKSIAVNKMNNLRFKVYLKSNLEILYQDEEGDIIWLDWKGREMNVLSGKKQYSAPASQIHTKAPYVTVPLYQDSNGAIIAGGVLYGYADRRIHEGQNPGYMSVLEIMNQSVEDGTGTWIICTYNYEKSSDVLPVISHDKWDGNAPTYTS